MNKKEYMKPAVKDIIMMDCEELLANSQVTSVSGGNLKYGGGSKNGSGVARGRNDGWDDDWDE